MSDGCRYCEGRSARYVVYVRDTERNVPSTEGVATTAVVACDCASPERRCALSSGGGGPETKGPATTAREFARFCQQQGMANGVQWALDPTAQVQRLMMRAYPYPGSPLEGLKWDALAELERLATGEDAQTSRTVEPYGAHKAFSGVTPTQESEAPPASDSGGHSGGGGEPFDPEHWRDNYPAWMGGDCEY